MKHERSYIKFGLNRMSLEYPYCYTPMNYTNHKQRSLMFNESPIFGRFVKGRISLSNYNYFCYGKKSMLKHIRLETHSSTKSIADNIKNTRFFRKR